MIRGKWVVGEPCNWMNTCVGPGMLLEVPSRLTISGQLHHKYQSGCWKPKVTCSPSLEIKIIMISFYHVISKDLCLGYWRPHRADHIIPLAFTLKFSPFLFHNEVYFTRLCKRNALSWHTSSTPCNPQQISIYPACKFSSLAFRCSLAYSTTSPTIHLVSAKEDTWTLWLHTSQRANWTLDSWSDYHLNRPRTV